MAEQDYLDKRWAKTGCKPLNKQTKNALVPTDWQEPIRDNSGNPTGEFKNRQRLYFKKYIQRGTLPKSFKFIGILFR